MQFITQLENRWFWPAATALAVLALCVSILAGKWIGYAAIERAAHARSGDAALNRTLPPEVVGGRPLAAAVPGELAVIWMNVGAGTDRGY